MRPIRDADDRTVGYILKERKYGVDEYQREYDWDSKNIQELIDDLYSKFLSNYDENHEREEVEKYDGYFLGSIILSRREGVRKRFHNRRSTAFNLTYLTSYIPPPLTKTISN
ncbi:MAG: DUF262 domain-containing protein [Candidatus Stahlbacteria bacterium]|nr:MAG: DUF262 domain-containing protein [Candidatus Stahlbacteria bacterium]